MQPSSDAIVSEFASIDIDATPDAVYDLVSDITRMGEWSAESVGGEWLHGGTGAAGDWFRGDNKAGEREWSRECQVAAADRGRDFTFVVLGIEKDCTSWSFEMEPIESGTRLTQRWWIVNKTPAMAAATDEQFASRIEFTKGMLAGTCSDIKAAAEAV